MDPLGTRSPCGKTRSCDDARRHATLTVRFGHGDRGAHRGRRGRPRRCRSGRPSASSASRARASRRSPARSSGLVPIAGGEVLLDGAPVPKQPGQPRGRPRPPRADGLPGSVRLAQPADDGRRGDRRGRRLLRGGAARGARRGEVQQLARARPPRPGRSRAAPEPPLRRSAAARGDRTGARRAPRGADRRRDHVVARRLGAERRPEPDARAARRARHLDDLRLAQPRDRALRQRRARGDVPGADRRDGADRGGRRRRRSIRTRRSLLAAVPLLGVSIRDSADSRRGEPPDPHHPPTRLPLHPAARRARWSTRAPDLHRDRIPARARTSVCIARSVTSPRRRSSRRRRHHRPERSKVHVARDR